MAKITNVTVVNSHTLRLNENASVNDEIDLLEISKIDNSLIEAKINSELQKELTKKIEEARKAFETEKKASVLEAVNQVSLENTKLKEQLVTAKLNAEKDLEIKYLNLLKEQEAKLLNEKLQLQTELDTLKNKLSQIDELNKAKFDLALHEKDSIINSLKLEKSMLNVKKLGEELELWCNTEYENYAQCGFDGCTWEKDNTSIKNDDEGKGSKADYIFRVFTDDSKKYELTSVALEMKNESPNSTNKKKNADHYLKLDKDRKKKNCEYALLVSELEWDQANDLPIRKVKEYEKMYVVRPQYFITFLSIIYSMSKKYQELLIDEIKEQELFKDANLIKEEFEKFKNDLIDKPIAKLEKELTSIITNAEAIKKASDKIIDSANDLINKTLIQMKTKIENYKITKTISKIEKLN